jgi:hypothetical protein
VQVVPDSDNEANSVGSEITSDFEDFIGRGPEEFNNASFLTLCLAAE